MNIVDFVKLITLMTLFYPIVLSLIWIIGGLTYAIKTKKIEQKELIDYPEQKFIILLSAYNEERFIFDNVTENLKVNYQNYEIWTIDDQSTDHTFSELQKINDSHLKVFRNEVNMGKAHTLNKYIDLIEEEYFVVIDSDTILDKDSLKYLNVQIQKDIENASANNEENKYAAYTGNITVTSQIKNRVYYAQKIEYRSFIDMIKRTQFIFTNSLFTLSGAFSCYRTETIKEIGKFNVKNKTEDINISWRLNQVGYRLKYINQMKAKVYTPLTMFNLIKQRERWTIGMLQTLKQNMKSIFSLKNNFLKLYFLEMVASGIWAFTLFFSSLYYIFNILTKTNENLTLINFIYGIALVLIFSITLSTIAYYLSDNDNERIKDFVINYVWFPFAYYLVQPIGFTFGLFSMIFKDQDGKWRKQSKTIEKYALATITDIFITFIIFRIILELLEDFYTRFATLEVVTLIVIYIILEALFLIWYYARLRLGDTLVNVRYPLRINIGFYLGIVVLIYNVYLMINYLNGIYTAQVFFVFTPIQFIITCLVIIILFSVCSIPAKKAKVRNEALEF